MPGGDRTGPRGLGPRTGRRAGFCEGNNSPGYMNRPIFGFARRGLVPRGFRFRRFRRYLGRTSSRRQREIW